LFTQSGWTENITILSMFVLEMSSTAHRGDQLKPRKRSQASPLTVCDAQSAPRDEGRVDRRGFRVVACVPWTDVALRACILLRALGNDQSQRVTQTGHDLSDSFRIEGSGKLNHEDSPGTVVAQPIEVHAMSFGASVSPRSPPRHASNSRHAISSMTVPPAGRSVTASGPGGGASVR
jgi:hypothetical protein